MKAKITLFVLALMVISVSIKAQSILNSSFENWTNKTLYEEPDSFQTSNMFAYLLTNSGNTVKSTDKYSGSYSIKLSTIVQGNDTVAGTLILGSGSQGNLGGISYTDKPDTLKVAVKYNVLTTDTAVVAVIFTKLGAYVGMAFQTFLGVQSSWKMKSIPITWMLPVNPDSMIFIASCSNLDRVKVPGSWLQMDNLELSGNVTQIPNSGFENWNPVSIEEPDDWWTLNFTGIYNNSFSATKSTDAYHGTYALRLETQGVFDDTIGYITNGYFGDNGPVGGMAVTQNPHKLTGWYKYTPVGPDTALAAMFSLDYTATDTIMVDSNIVKLPAAYNYTYFEVPLNYNAWPIIDTLNISFASSNIMDDSPYAGVGSVLYIDSLNLTYKPLSIDENGNLKNEFKVFPNPASDIVNITSSLPVNGDLRISIYNSIGKKVIDEILSPMSFNDFFKLDISKLKPAIYLYQIQTDDDLINGKIIVR
ncbi:MAG: T9SS type A sorting domain-containing protein [Saprospiraceae bacterium]|nr:T9SS type A sorting domain-containing protein [Saprospiraceae bacterium]